MTGKFTPIDQRRCSHYARFMNDLSLTQANAVFWSLFILVLAMMCISSWQNYRSNTLLDLEKRLLPPKIRSKSYREKIFRKRRGYFCIVVLCFLFSIVCIVLECFALFNIQFCDREDLTQLYWGLWSILQVGGLIAIAGVLLQFWIILSGVRTPPWAVALGTPVLVFAALGWMFKHIFDGAWHKYRSRYLFQGEDGLETGAEGARDEGKSVEARQCANRCISRAPTLVPEYVLASRDEAYKVENNTTDSLKRMSLERTLTM